ncbi:MAG TPA: DUF6494 family protein [Rhodocyclaceae bacterium]|nr:DUF6494 family protein [Rhodocyclaceae bacterium]
MNEETLNLSIRKYLKKVGVNSQREIEQAIARAIADGTIAGSETLIAHMRLEIPDLNLDVKFEGPIELE